MVMIIIITALILSSKAQQGRRVTWTRFLQEAGESWQEAAEGTKAPLLFMMPSYTSKCDFLGVRKIRKGCECSC